MKTKSKPAPLSWEPRRVGPIFCSPACGGGCTREQFRVATREADALCKTLDQTTPLKGWTPYVWENLGWHYKAVSPCGRIKVHFGYTAYLGQKALSGGQWAENAKTPAKAVAAVIRTAKEELAKVGAEFKDL
jgi:hypothetical protein